MTASTLCDISGWLKKLSLQAAGMSAFPKHSLPDILTISNEVLNLSAGIGSQNKYSPAVTSDDALGDGYPLSANMQLDTR